MLFQLTVHAQNAMSISHQIAGSLSARLHRNPKFQIALRIISSIAITMMNVFKTFKRAANHFAHDKPMLRNVSGFTSHRMIVASKHKPVATTRENSSAFPTSRLAAFLQSIMMPMNETQRKTGIVTSLSGIFNYQPSFASAPAFTQTSWALPCQRWLRTPYSAKILMTRDETYRIVTMMAFRFDASAATASADFWRHKEYSNMEISLCQH